MKYLLDTDHISVLQHQDGVEYVILTTRMAEQHSLDFALPVVSFHEQAMGAHAYINRSKREADIFRRYAILFQILGTFSGAIVLPFDSAAATMFGDLSAQYPRVATMDLRIAAIAIARNLILLSRNR